MGKTSLNRLYAVSVLFVCLASSVVGQLNPEGPGSASSIGNQSLENPGQQSRSGIVDVSGMTALVLQPPAVTCQFSPPALFVGSGLVDITSRTVVANCSLVGVTPTAPWAQYAADQPVRFRMLQPNLTGETRSATFSIGGGAVTIHQSPGGRNTDFDNDGWLDLLWHHEADGRVSAWLMRSTQRIDGRLLTPNQVPDTNWKPVAAGDMDRDGTADILWQHATDGRIAFWRMIDTTMLRGDPTSPSQVSDTNWKIRALADFNQDGDADFGVAEPGNGTNRRLADAVPAWIDVLSQRRPPGTRTGSRSELEDRGSGDFNRDG